MLNHLYNQSLLLFLSLCVPPSLTRTFLSVCTSLQAWFRSANCLSKKLNCQLVKKFHAGAYGSMKGLPGIRRKPLRTIPLDETLAERSKSKVKLIDGQIFPFAAPLLN